MNAPRKVSRKAATRTMDAVIRVSRVNQREGDRFLSPTQQRDRIRAWAKANRVSISRWHDELDRSGRTVEREGLQAALERAKAGTVDGIIVAKVDRFARTLVGGLTAIRELRDAGATFVAVQEGIDGETQGTPSGRLFLGLLLLMAEWQLDTLTVGWEAVREHSIANGIAGHAPFGYMRDGSRRLVPDPTEAPWVVRLFTERAQGASWTALADMLNDAGVQPRRGQRFTHARVRDLVHNVTYRGVLRSGSYVNETAHEPLVSAEQWEAAHGRRSTSVRRDAEPFLLSGLVRCASCGVRMAGMVDRKRLASGEVKAYPYYRCRRSHSFGRCPAPAKVRADEVEPAVEARFRDLYLADRDLVATEVLGDDVAQATAAVRAAQAEVEAYVVSTPASLDRAVYAKGLAVRQEALDEAQDALQAAEAAQHGVSLPRGLSDAWEGLSVEDRRGFLSDGLATVAVAPGGAVGIWAVNDPAAPAGLPGLGTGVAALTPLCVPTGPGAEAT